MMYLTISAHQDDVGFITYVLIAKHFGKKNDMKKRSVREMRYIAGLTLKACMKYSLSRVDSNEEPRL